MLTEGNTKLGPLVHSFSIPAGTTCPGKTEVCSQSCYAKHGFFLFPSTQAAHRHNNKLRKRKEFVPKILTELKEKRVKVVRIHASGDFDSAKYIRDWIKIVKARPDVTFYAYSRSWRIQRLLPWLIQLSVLPNFHLWWSTDSETVAAAEKPPAIPGIRIAYMKRKAEERIPANTQLVFRVQRNTVEKFTGKRFTCPVEQGVARKAKITCSKCKLCFSDTPMPKFKKPLKQITRA